MMAFALLFALQADPAVANDQDSTGKDIVVRAAIPPHCRQRPGDPLDAVQDLPHHWALIKVGRDGSVKAVQDTPYWFTGPDYWQRSGEDLGNFIFRVPQDENPICIGAKKPSVTGGVQLRRVLDPRGFIGAHVRLTAFAASRDAKDGSFWINGGGGEKNFIQIGFSGTRGWTPVSIDTRVSERFPRLMYGMTLGGGGDIWLYDVHLEVVGINGKVLRRL
jgi:hypothetical protein